MFTLTRLRRFANYVVVFALLAPVLPPMAAPALAENITVCPSGCDFTTIPAALAAADDGDFINIAAGTYAGGIDIRKDVGLFGAGRNLTTITGGARDSVIHVRNGANVRIEDVTITGGGGSPFGPGRVGGGGILNEGALSLTDTIVRDNAVVEARSAIRLVGGGIANLSTKPLKILRTVIRDNQAGFGGGLYNESGEILITDSTISGNRTNNSGDGGGVFLERSTKPVTLRNSTIAGNVSMGQGGGVFTAGALVLSDTTISGNSASVRGGGLQSGNQSVQITRGIISGNSAQGGGGGLLIGSGGATIQDSTIESNQGSNGGGISVSQGDVTLRLTKVVGNTARADGGGVLLIGARIILNASQVSTNSAGHQGGGIYADTGAGQLVLRSGANVSNNRPDDCVGVDCS